MPRDDITDLLKKLQSGKVDPATAQALATLYLAWAVDDVADEIKRIRIDGI